MLWMKCCATQEYTIEKIMAVSERNRNHACCLRLMILTMCIGVRLFRDPIVVKFPQFLFGFVWWKENGKHYDSIKRYFQDTLKYRNEQNRDAPHSFDFVFVSLVGQNMLDAEWLPFISGSPSTNRHASWAHTFNMHALHGCKASARSPHICRVTNQQVWFEAATMMSIVVRERLALLYLYEIRTSSG